VADSLLVDDCKTVRFKNGWPHPLPNCEVTHNKRTPIFKRQKDLTWWFLCSKMYYTQMTPLLYIVVHSDPFIRIKTGPHGLYHHLASGIPSLGTVVTIRAVGAGWVDFLWEIYFEWKYHWKVFLFMWKNRKHLQKYKLTLVKKSTYKKFFQDNWHIDRKTQKVPNSQIDTFIKNNFLKVHFATKVQS
jgi:hypothetical protein